MLIGIELLLGLISERLRRGFHLAAFALLATATALGLLDLDDTVPAFLVAVGLGFAAAVAYVRLRAARSLMSVLAPAPIVFLVLFLSLSDVSRLVFSGAPDVQAASVSARAPVVLVVFDELPLASLMDSSGHIDRRHFPNFARLADDASWYRNTTTVHADTPYAVPAIMDGDEPEVDRLPVADDHRRSIFSLLGGAYALHVQEEATVVCPRELCHEAPLPGYGRRMRRLWGDTSRVFLHQLLPRGLRRDLPSVASTWRRFRGEVGAANTTAIAAAAERAGVRRRSTKRARKHILRGHLNKGRPARVEHFVAGIRGGGRPRFHFIHALLPHVPYQYLPDGRFYREQPNEEIPGLNSSTGFHVPWLVEQGYQRHLLQVGETDRVLGELIDRLKRVGLYDRALIAVVADHGASFQLGFDRRYVRAGNIQDIAPVPFLLKTPRQLRGRISDKPLRTIDVLPTIADELGIKVPWRVDGRAASAPTTPAQRNRRVIGKHFRYSIPIDVPGYQRARRAALSHRNALFGKDLFAIGPRRQLIGQRVAALRPVASSGPAARFIGAARYRDVRPETGFMPVHAVGRIEGGLSGGGRILALAVGGRIAATGYSFSLRGDPAEDFSFLMPESALRPGRNRLEVLWLRPDGGVERLGAS